jgi:hypothetical protein
MRRVGCARREVDEEGLSGVRDLIDWTHLIAWFVMSVMKW